MGIPGNRARVLLCLIIVLPHLAGGLIYQSPRRQTNSGGYLPKGANEAGFKVGSYNPDYPLVIDPTPLYSSYLGGSGTEIAYGVAIDAAGYVYVTGSTSSTNFVTTPGAYQRENKGGTDIFVAKLNPAGNTLVYSTLIGSDGADVARGIAVDSEGNALIVGDTTSRTFPLVNPLQANYGGHISDGFVAKLNPTGSALVYSTYLGGDGEEYGNGIAIDSAGNAYVTGFTSARDFPLANALQSTFGGGFIDAFVAKLNSAGSSLAYSTYLGGSRDDGGLGIATDSTSNAYLSGSTNSTNYPLEKPLQAANGGNSDVVVTKINPTGSALVYSTYFGGSQDEFGRGIAVDTEGFAYVTGDTSSSDFPTSSPAQPTFGGGNFDAFVMRLGPTGNGPLYSTYLGGGGLADSGDDEGRAIAVDSLGQAYVAGYTRSNIFPLANSLQMAARHTDGFVTKLNPAGVPIVYSTYLGGSGEDQANSIEVDANGNAYVVGFTTSSDFPIASPLQESPGGAEDGFVTKLGADQRNMGLIAVSAASYSRAPIAVESIASAFGVGMTATSQAATTTPLPTSLAGTTLSLNGKFVSLFYISPSQINFQVPPGINTGTGAFTLTNQGAIIGAGIAQIVNVSPGLFAANANGQGVALAVALRVRANGSLVYEPVARFDAAQNRFVPTPIDLGPETDQVFLVLFGTGIRFRSSLSSVVTRIGGTDAQVSYAGAQGDWVGLDQVNVHIPRSLIGRGEVDVTMTADGEESNKVTVSIK
jgi:uncharacterized protein (TIGR03437 family)